MDNLMELNEPAILTQDVRSQKPGASHEQRRLNEMQRVNEVAAWLDSLGFDTDTFSTSVRGWLRPRPFRFFVSFEYRESPWDVKCYLYISRNNRKLNIAQFRHALALRTKISKARPSAAP